MSSARIYSTVNNAFIFSPYSTVDPETSNGIALEEGSPLTTATYIFGLNLKFLKIVPENEKYINNTRINAFTWF